MTIDGIRIDNKAIGLNPQLPLPRISVGNVYGEI